MALVWTALIAILTVWLIARFGLGGRPHDRFDRPRPKPAFPRETPSDGHAEVLDRLSNMPGADVPRADRLRVSRETFDAVADELVTEATFTPVDAGGVPAEWVTMEDSDPDCRLLYIHGGGFMMGSPKSHRYITSRLAELSGGAVLSIDYRLQPEHPRIDTIRDCHTAYRWILENAPNGPGAPDTLYVAGDSAGGNLTLMTIAWARDEGLRPANAAVALSPATDSTFSSPSLKANIHTDAMLGPMMGPMTKMPRTFTLWMGFASTRFRPCHPLVSPLHGDLGGLPPVLIQASEAEMLHDDAVRYVNKATESGTNATLQTWQHVVHVWHAFGDVLPEADEAFTEIGQFLAAHRQSGQIRQGEAAAD